MGGMGGGVGEGDARSTSDLDQARSSRDDAVEQPGRDSPPLEIGECEDNITGERPGEEVVVAGKCLLRDGPIIAK